MKMIVKDLKALPIDLEIRVSMAEIKEKLRRNPGNYDPRYTAYLADRLGDELSPREFFERGNEVIREMASGQSSDPTKPVPSSVYVYARIQGSFLITDLGIALVRDYCPPEFAKAVRALHQEAYLE